MKGYFLKTLGWLIILLVIPWRMAFAQPSINVQVDRDTVTVDDEIRLSITIRGGSALTTPDIPPKGNFEVLGKSSGNAIEIVNGQMSVTNTFEYLLKPRKPGTFSIGPIKTYIEGQTYSAGPVKIKVLPSGRTQTYQAMPGIPPGTSPVPQAPPQFFPPGPGGPGGTFTPQTPQEPKETTFLTAQMDKQEAYIGEQVLYTFRLYSAVSLQNAQLKLPDFKDFISEELIQERKYEVDIQGRRYAVNEWRLALFPTKAGNLHTGTASVQANVMVPMAPRDPFNDPFFNRFPMSRRFQTKSFTARDITLRVKELPPAPPGYTGLVGDFSIQSHLDQERMNTGDTANLKVTIKGRGNIQEANLSKLAETQFFKVYPGTPKVETDKTLNGIEGKKVFTYALVAQRPGQTSVGPLDTYYFNPQTESYEKLEVPQTEIFIHGSGTQESLVTAGIDKPKGILGEKERSLSLKDIQEVDSVLRRQVPTRYGSVLWWSMLLGGPGLFALVWGWRRSRERALAQADDRKRSKAFRKAKSALGRVKMQGDTGSIDALTQVIREYLSDSFLIKGGAMTPGEVEVLLTENKIPAENVRRMTYLLEQLDSWKYSGQMDQLPAGQDMRQEIINLLREIERSL